MKNDLWIDCTGVSKSVLARVKQKIEYDYMTEVFSPEINGERQKFILFENARGAARVVKSLGLKVSERPDWANELFVETVNGKRTITDHTGRELTIEEARKLWKTGKVWNSNISFRRLATEADFNFERLADLQRS